MTGDPAAPQAAASGSGHGHGKVILLGEHAVVYGQPALAGAIDLGVRATATACNGDPPRVLIPAWGIDVPADDVHPAARAAWRISAALACDQQPMTLTAHASVPPQAGLGSSAAMAVAVARAIAGAHGLATTDAAIAAAANAAETEFHHRPSGVDVALAMRGGIGVFRRDVGFVPIAAPSITLAVGLSGDGRSTSAMVDRVAAAIRGTDDPRITALGEHAAAGAADLARGDLVDLGARMSAAHVVLADLGVSSAKLDELVAVARDAGALGAKLTGAGGGGAVIALAPAREAVVLAAWQAAGYTAMLVTLG
jgi:mevalonate kinase